MFCHVGQEQVLSVHDVSSVYHVPLLLRSQGLIPFLQKRLNLHSIAILPALKERGEGLSTRWKALTQR
jgi:CTP synthase